MKLFIFSSLFLNNLFLDVSIKALLLCLAVECKPILMTSGVSVHQLASVWDLAHTDRDGSLNEHQFVIACHLIRFIKKGKPLLVHTKYNFLEIK